MKIEDITVGDVLRIREWDDMADEFEEIDGIIYCTFMFTDEMESLCGKTFTVKRIQLEGDDYRIWSEENVESRFSISADMLEPFQSEYTEESLFSILEV